MFKKKKERFKDGLVSTFNTITNHRNALDNNRIYSKKLDDSQLRNIYKTGVASKIVRLKVGYALNKTIEFNKPEYETYYNQYLRKEIKRACRFMLVFGRGVVMNYYNGDDLSKPLRVDLNRQLKVKAFAGDEASVLNINRDLYAPQYNKPEYYMVKSAKVHHTRIIDFSYVEPPEYDLDKYNYGGISELEMIYDELIADKIVARASANIVEKNSSLFYKVKDFFSKMSTQQSDKVVEYFTMVENMRSNNGATLLDSEDSVEVHNQALSNLRDISDLTLRRLAMVTGIPVAILVGENVQGLNATGDNERQIFQDTIETLQSEYIMEPLQLLFNLHNIGVISFKENQGDTPQARITYEKEVINNAFVLFQMGEDYSVYLNNHEVTMQENYQNLFTEDES